MLSSLTENLSSKARSEVDICRLVINSPKRTHNDKQGWSGLFPYYAGFSEKFAYQLVQSAELASGARIFDPWNGSGTTTSVSSFLGFDCVGVDVNPAMVVIARSRTLPVSERASIAPLGREILSRASQASIPCNSSDPLLRWFGRATAEWIRAVERAIFEILIGESQGNTDPIKEGRLSAFAATFYFALFITAQDICQKPRSSNPTWMKIPKKGEAKSWSTRDKLKSKYTDVIEQFSKLLSEVSPFGAVTPAGSASLYEMDTTKSLRDLGKFDFILSSPPYCTRIDYTAATVIPLAILWPLLRIDMSELSRIMLGSIKVPLDTISPLQGWGDTCNKFLSDMRTHPSKASAGYYLKTHLDYFDKLMKSMCNISESLKSGGVAVLVVQDSHYKEIHNDLPRIVSEMGQLNGLTVSRIEAFQSRTVMANRHRHTRTYRSNIEATESVLCLMKNPGV